MGLSRAIAIVTAAVVLPATAAEASAARCDLPADVLDLSNWKITLPVDDPDREGTQPMEVLQPRLKDYEIDPWFVAERGGVRFRVAVNGVTTPNSKYPRSELREMNGDRGAAWPAATGRHTMVVEQAITALPQQRPYLVAGQIHDGSDDISVFRLEGKKLYLTNGDTSHHKLITDDYELGTRFQARFEVRNGEIRAFYNGRHIDTIPATFTTGYFKAGAYVQANCTNSAPCDDSNYGQVVIYKLKVSHF